MPHFLSEEVRNSEFVKQNELTMQIRCIQSEACLILSKIDSRNIHSTKPLLEATVTQLTKSFAADSHTNHKP